MEGEEELLLILLLVLLLLIWAKVGVSDAKDMVASAAMISGIDL
jgi:hypothetical protein